MTVMKMFLDHTKILKTEEIILIFSTETLFQFFEICQKQSKGGQVSTIVTIGNKID